MACQHSTSPRQPLSGHQTLIDQSNFRAVDVVLRAHTLVRSCPKHEKTVEYNVNPPEWDRPFGSEWHESANIGKTIARK